MFSQPWLRAVALWAATSLLVSVQRGTITLNSVTSNTATVTAVVTADAVLAWGGNQLPVAAGGYLNLNARLALTNATTITATINAATAADTTVSWELYHFMPGVISVQRGTVTGAATATPTAVDTNKTMLFYLGQETDNGVGDTSKAARIVLTNSTTITQTTSGGAATITGWQLVSFL